MDKYKLIHVKWTDSYGCSSQWAEIPDKKPVEHYCYSVGWLVRQSKHAIVVIPHISPENKDIDSEEHGCGEMVIPRKSIICINNIPTKRFIK